MGILARVPVRVPVGLVEMVVMVAAAVVLGGGGGAVEMEMEMEMVEVVRGEASVKVVRQAGTAHQYCCCCRHRPSLA